MKSLFKYLFLFFVLVLYSSAIAQSNIKRALFLGNSYTYVNNLPQMVADVASSTGDSLIFDSNTPGGYTLEGHSTNATSLAKIAMGNWDYVVLQEQSQRPSFPINQVITDVFPYARFLDSVINAQNICAETAFYMTWGRKNGDASNCAVWPPVCTYSGMDSLLRLRYMMMADSNDAIVSPVGAVWNFIRQNYPLIELYQADESHPSVAGSYAAACSFYTTFFRKDPTAITYDAGLPPSDAAGIRNAAKLVVYDSLLNWHIGEYDPLADFNYLNSGVNQVTFTNNSVYATNYYWNFGDGNSSTNINPTYTYSSPGSYLVMLIAEKCGLADTLFQTINVASVSIDDLTSTKNMIIFPNPVSDFINIEHHITGDLSFTIINVTGQAIAAGTLSGLVRQINVSQLEQGIYLIMLFESNQLIGRQKFLKNNFKKQ